MKPLLPILAFLSIPSTSSAQTGAPASSPAKGEAPPASSRPASVERPHSQVVVTLLNGEKVKGLVRAGKTPEKPGGLLGFVNAKPEEKTAGIRLWYVFGTNSFIFLPMEVVKSMETVARLSDLEVKELDKKMEEEAARTKAETEARLSMLRALHEQQGSDRDLIARLQDLARLEEEAAATRDRDAKYRDLLSKFSPEKGWTPERLMQIRARIVNDVFPSEEEREFVKVYEDWRKAYEASQAGSLEPPASRPAREEKPTSRSAPRE
ncbi:MAG TPA: hypothetical protein VFI25_18250 [Planctomycetota bacterium]|jgi:hypothetical protein|nr:hypothetical protein [Planctomycetota bacterium]